MLITSISSWFILFTGRLLRMVDLIYVFNLVNVKRPHSETALIIGIQFWKLENIGTIEWLDLSNNLKSLINSDSDKIVVEVY